MFKSGVLQALEGAHGEISLNDGMEGATREVVAAALRKASGVPDLAL